MNKVQTSLIENESEILASLPKEFHEDFKKELSTPAVEEAPLSGSAEVAAIKAELAANPSVDESAAAPELKDIKAPAAVVLPTEAESAAEQATLLAEVKAAAGKS